MKIAPAQTGAGAGVVDRIVGATMPGTDSDVHDYTSERMSRLMASPADTVTPEPPKIAKKTLGVWRGMTSLLETQETPGVSPASAATLSDPLRSSIVDLPTSMSSKSDARSADQDAGYTPPTFESDVDTTAEATSPVESARGSFASPEAAIAAAAALMPAAAKQVSTTTESCIVTLTFIALGGVLYWTQTVLVPLIMAVFVASMLVPMVDALTDRPLRLFNRTWCAPCCQPILNLDAKYSKVPGHGLFTSILTLRLPNVLSLVVVILCMFLVFFSGGYVMYGSISVFVEHAPEYEAQVIRVGNQIANMLMFDTSQAVVVAYPVATETDSAEQCDAFQNMNISYAAARGTCDGGGLPPGTVVTQGGDLALGASNATVAIRFPRVKLKNDVTIAKAFVIFDIDEVRAVSSRFVNISIRGETTRSREFPLCCSEALQDAANHDGSLGHYLAQHSPDRYDLSGPTTARQVTDSVVYWEPEPSVSLHEALRTVDVKEIITEIIQSPGWVDAYAETEGNPLALTFQRIAGDGVRSVEKLAMRDSNTGIDPWPPADLMQNPNVDSDNLAPRVNTPVLVVIYDESGTSNVLEKNLGLSAQAQHEEVNGIAEWAKSSGFLADAALGLLDTLLGAVGTASLIMLYTIFILLGRQARKKRKERKVTYAVEHRLKVYISWKCLISLVTGAAVALTLHLVSCDLAALFGILTFMLNFIPTVGLLLAVLLPLPIVVFAPNCNGAAFVGSPDCPAGFGMSSIERVLAIAIPYCIQLVVANFVEPVVLGKRLNLHPVVVLVSLVFWFMMWGIAGAFLSVPIMSVIKIFCHNMHNNTAQWIAAALEGNVESDESSVADEHALSVNQSHYVNMSNSRSADEENNLYSTRTSRGMDVQGDCL